LQCFLLVSLTKPIFYLAECRSEIAGYILGVLENDGSCHIVSIAVKEKWRRRRIGSLLLNTLLEECRKHGAWRAILEVAVDNKPAVNLYLKHGFIVKKIIPRYYSSGRDAFFMEKNFEKPIFQFNQYSGLKGRFDAVACLFNNSNDTMGFLGSCA